MQWVKILLKQSQMLKHITKYRKRIQNLYLVAHIENILIMKK